MPAKTLNRRFFLLQAIMMLMDCITVAYISPILVSLGYSNLQIGQVMTLGALAATAARQRPSAKSSRRRSRRGAPFTPVSSPARTFRRSVTGR